ncbi:photosystem I assembly protein Ycf3 [mine drainage metagenome]|uniref:protein O-GlcNAc transferase n=1 Tax=mine drainage metagenome TaxID=410659 RepID=A0A1J5RZF1_9ZZZZ
MTSQGNAQLELRISKALSLYQAGHKQQAELIYRDVLLTNPNQPNANYHLGVIALEIGLVDDSLPFFKTALEADPQEASYWLGYIDALIQATHYEEAQLVLSYGLQAGLSGQEVNALISIMESKLGSEATQDQISLTLTSVEDELIDLFSKQQYKEVERRVQSLVQEYPHWLVGWKILSDTLLVQRKDARFSASKALELNSMDAKEHCYYGLVLKNQGDLKGAAMAFEQAVKLKPDYAAAYNNLGIVKKDTGDVEAGIRNYRRALELNPGYASCYSNLLFCLSHSTCIDVKALFNEHRLFSVQYELPLKAAWHIHANQRNPERCLRIGFVSADFRDHSLAYFIEPLLNYLSISSSLSLHAYSASSLEDDVTQRLRGQFKGWSKVDAMTNDMLATKIREDGIDILVDLDGHTAGNRLLVFAMKPAPIQVSWLGYLATTGLTAMDYYLADGYLLPPGKLDCQFTEKIVQLPANAPFMPFDTAPEVNALPALKNGYITFACFNRINKITQSVVRLWSKLLNAVPNAKMLLGGMPQDGSYDTIIEWFALEGVLVERLIFHSRSSIDNYLLLHHEVDICLDTFPSNGVTTTCHALWMGIPTLCIEGESLASRGALGVMKHVGLNEFVALSESDFVDKGLYWSSHAGELAQIRASLRNRFEQSNLARPESIAKGLERAFRQMWQQWCKHLPAESFEVSLLK